MHGQRDRGALRLVHPVFDREPVDREDAGRIRAIADQDDDDQPAARGSVVDRVLRLLTVFADGPRVFNLSTTHRLAKQLVEHDVLRKDDHGHYSIGPALLAIASHTVHDDTDGDS